jgi:hypothetical protein
MYFSPDGLALGAGTILLSAVGPRRLADLQGEEARLLALLSAAYGKAISPSVLGNVERAAKCWREGDETAAVTHLVHAGLPLPVDPSEEARRLFVTDAFIKTGTSPIDASARSRRLVYRGSREALQSTSAARAGRQRHPQRPLDEDSFIPR